MPRMLAASRGDKSLCTVVSGERQYKSVLIAMAIRFYAVLCSPGRLLDPEKDRIAFARCVVVKAAEFGEVLLQLLCTMLRDVDLGPVGGIRIVLPCFFGDGKRIERLSDAFYTRGREC